MKTKTFLTMALVALTVMPALTFNNCACEEEEVGKQESYAEVKGSYTQTEDSEQRFDAVEKGIAFGDLQAGFTKTAFIYIENNGGAKFIVNDAVLTGEGAAAYRLEGFEPETSIARYEETSFKVIFAPQGSGEFEAVLKITTTDPGTPESLVKITGEGVDVTVNDLEFGEVKIKETRQGDVFVEHTHKSPVKISQIYFTETTSDAYAAFLSNTKVIDRTTGKSDVNIELQPGQKHNITVSYQPLRHQADDGELVFEIAEPVKLTLKSKLSGKGVSPVVALVRDGETPVITSFIPNPEFDFGVVKEKQNPSEPNPSISFYILNIGDGDDDLEIKKLNWFINGDFVDEDPSYKFTISEAPAEGTKLKAIALPENGYIDPSSLSAGQYAKVTVEFNNSVRLAAPVFITMRIETNDSIVGNGFGVVDVNFMARVPSARIIRYPIGGYEKMIEGFDLDGDRKMDTLVQNFEFRACNAGEIPLTVSGVEFYLRRTNTLFETLDTSEYPYSIDAPNFPVVLQPEATAELREAVGRKNDCSNATDVFSFNVVGTFTEPDLYYRATADAEGKVAIPVVVFESDDPNNPCTDPTDTIKFPSNCPIPVKIQVVYQDTYVPKPQALVHPDGYEETLTGAQNKKYQFTVCNSGDADLEVKSVKIWVEGNSFQYKEMTPGQFPYSIEAPNLPFTVKPEATKGLQDAVKAANDCSNATHKYEFTVTGNFTEAKPYFDTTVGKHSVPAIVVESNDPKYPCNNPIDPSFHMKCAKHLKITVE